MKRLSYLNWGSIVLVCAGFVLGLAASSAFQPEPKAFGWTESEIAANPRGFLLECIIQTKAAEDFLDRIDSHGYPLEVSGLGTLSVELQAKLIELEHYQVVPENLPAYGIEIEGFVNSSRKPAFEREMKF